MLLLLQLFSMFCYPHWISMLSFKKKKKLVGEGDSNLDSHYRDNSTMSLNHKTLGKFSFSYEEN